MNLIKVSVLFFAVMFFSVSCTEIKSEKKTDPVEITHKILIETSEGNIVVGLYGNGMPETVKNFVSYAAEKYYNGLIFHRVVKNFVIQGGGFSEDMVQKEAKAPIKLEMPPSEEVKSESGKISKKLLINHDKYSLAMARTRDPHSATSQFYITLAPQKQLDPNPEHNQPNGYAVFGKVIEGFETVDKIGSKPVQQFKGHSNVPIEAVKIINVNLLGETK